MTSAPVGIIVEMRKSQAIVAGLPFWANYRPRGARVEVVIYSAETGAVMAYGHLEGPAGRLASVARISEGGAASVGMLVRYKSKPPSIPLEFLDSEFHTSFGGPYGLLYDGIVLPDVGIVGLTSWEELSSVRAVRVEGQDNQGALSVVAIYDGGPSCPPGFTYVEGDVRESLYRWGESPPVIQVGSGVVAINSNGEDLGSLAADDSKWDQRLRQEINLETTAVSVIAKRVARGLTRLFLKPGPRIMGIVVSCAAQVRLTGLTSPQLGEAIKVCDRHDKPIASGYVSWVPEHPQQVKSLQLENKAKHIQRPYCKAVINRGLENLKTGRHQHGEGYRFYKYEGSL